MTYSSRAVSSVGLMLFNAGIALFALAPILPEPNPLKLVELVIGIVAAVSAAGLFAAAVAYPRYGSRLAYLASAFTSTLTVLGFATEPDAPAWVRAIFSLLFLAGAIVSVGLHLEFGGRPSVAEAESHQP